jgi:large subunit ribosomal protein L24
LRNFLTFVAVALVTALTVALIAPPFIDWSARREMVARAVALRIGEPVRISGPIVLRLLPTPYLRMEDVAIGPREAPWLTGRSIRFEFGLSGVFGGKIALDDVAFDNPRLRFGPRFAAPATGRLVFGHIRAEHAEVRIERAGASPILLRDVSFDGSAASPRGPWRGDGELGLGAARAHYQFVSETFAGDALPLRAEIDSGPTRADVEGRLILADAPSFAGKATVVGRAAGAAWRIAGEIAASGEEATIAAGELRLGEDARAIEASGRLSLRFGDRLALDADLKGKTFDLDALLRGPKETFVPPARVGDLLAGLAQRALGRDAPISQVSVKIQAQAAYLGARAVSAPQLALAGAVDSPLRVKFASGLPGGGRLALDGALELGPAPIFRGRGQGEAGDFAALAAWIAEGRPDLARRLAALAAALPRGDISAAGDVELSSEGYAARGLKLGVAESRFNGDVVYRAPTPAQRGRLYLDLAAPALDIDAAPNIEAGLAWLGDSDLDLRVEADALRVGRVGLASVSGGSLALRAIKDGEAFALKRLSLADLGGASIEAEGAISPSERWLRVKLDARRLGDFAALLARAAPGAPTQWLLQRAEDLGAARATFEARREGPPLKGPFGFDFLKSEGTIAGARFALTLSQAPAPVDAISAQATASSPDVGGLARKLGLKLSPGAAAAGELSVSGAGRWDRGFDAKARLTLAGAEATWSGAFRPDAPDAELAGAMTLKSADLGPALAALGFATAGAAAPADLSAEVEAGPDGAHWRKLAGAIAGARVSGELAYAPEGALTGALTLDRASLGGLLSLVFGRSAPAPRGAVWADAKFAPALLTPPSLDIALHVDALDLGLGVGRAASARLGMDRDRLTLADASALLNGGKLSGRLDVRRGRAQATVSGALALQGVGIERAGLSARLDASLDFAGAGDSAAALIASLAGAGRLKVASAKIARLDPQALARVYKKIEQTDGPPPDAKKLPGLIGAELDKGPLTVEGAQGALSLSSGAIRFGPLDPPAGDGSVSGAFDLGRLSLTLEATETYPKAGRFWSGAAPQVGIIAGLEPPTRKIDAEFLAAGLAAEAIARESDRIQNFEADVRERAMFNRQRKSWLFLDRRAAEIAAFQADEERQRLMRLYLGPYSEWAASHGETAAPPPPTNGAGKNAAGL